MVASLHGSGHLPKTASGFRVWTWLKYNKGEQMGAAVLNAAGDLRHHICCGRTLDAFRLEIGIARKLELLSMHVSSPPEMKRPRLFVQAHDLSMTC